MNYHQTSHVGYETRSGRNDGTLNNIIVVVVVVVHCGYATLLLPSSSSSSLFYFFTRSYRVTKPFIKRNDKKNLSWYGIQR